MRIITRVLLQIYCQSDSKGFENRPTFAKVMPKNRVALWHVFDSQRMNISSVKSADALFLCDS